MDSGSVLLSCYMLSLCGQNAAQKCLECLRCRVLVLHESCSFLIFLAEFGINFEMFFSKTSLDGQNLVGLREVARVKFLLLRFCVHVLEWEELS